MACTTTCEPSCTPGKYAPHQLHVFLYHDKRATVFFFFSYTCRPTQLVPRQNKQTDRQSAKIMSSTQGPARPSASAAASTQQQQNASSSSVAAAMRDRQSRGKDPYAKDHHQQQRHQHPDDDDDDDDEDDDEDDVDLDSDEDGSRMRIGNV